MKIGLLRIGNPEQRLVQDLIADLEDALPGSIELLPGVLDPAPACHYERQQYHSSELLERMRQFARGSCTRLLGITDRDLYIPILTFVFGEAQMEGPCAIVSTFRLRQEFYGLPAESALLRERLLKEAAHELGHTFGLVHCDDYGCLMASSHSVEWIDLKGNRLCSGCRAQLMAGDAAVR